MQTGHLSNWGEKKKKTPRQMLKMNQPSKWNNWGCHPQSRLTSAQNRPTSLGSTSCCCSHVSWHPASDQWNWVKFVQRRRYPTACRGPPVSTQPVAHLVVHVSNCGTTWSFPDDVEEYLLCTVFPMSSTLQCLVARTFLFYCTLNSPVFLPLLQTRGCSLSIRPCLTRPEPNF